MINDRGEKIERPKLQIVSGHQLFRKKFPPKEYLLEPWFRKGWTTLLYAGTGQGKSWLTMSMAVAIAGGGTVGGWKCKTPRKVLLVDGEMHEEEVYDRFLSIIKDKCVTGVDKKAFLDNIKVIARQAQDPDSKFFDITTPQGQDHLMAAMRLTDCDLVIVDNLTTCADDLEDENSSVAFRPIQTFCLRVKQMGKSIIVVHHANKGGESYRGSTALATTFETIVALRKPEISVAGKASFIVEFEKYRGKGDASIQPRTWALTDKGWQITDADSEGQLMKLVTAMKSLNYVSGSELAEVFGVHKGQISRWFDKAIAKNLITDKDRREAYAKAKELRKRASRMDYDDPGETLGTEETDGELEATFDVNGDPVDVDEVFTPGATTVSAVD